MAGTSVDVSTGITIVFGTSGFTSEILDVAQPGVSRKSIDVSHMGTAAPSAGSYGNMPFIPGRLSDAGELTLDVHYNPDVVPPIDLVAETITVTFPLVPGDSTPAKIVFTGFFTAFDPSFPLDDKMVASATIKISGSVARTAAT